MKSRGRKKPLCTPSPDHGMVGFERRGHTLVFSTGGKERLNNHIVETVRGAERDHLIKAIGKELPLPKRR